MIHQISSIIFLNINYCAYFSCFSYCRFKNAYNNYIYMSFSPTNNYSAIPMIIVSYNNCLNLYFYIIIINIKSSKYLQII